MTKKKIINYSIKSTTKHKSTTKPPQKQQNPCLLDVESRLPECEALSYQLLNLVK